MILPQTMEWASGSRFHGSDLVVALANVVSANEYVAREQIRALESSGMIKRCSWEPTASQRFFGGDVAGRVNVYNSPETWFWWVRVAPLWSLGMRE